MNPLQAQEIRERYCGVPQQREEQERLIGLFYRGMLRGRRFSECSDAQIYSVARRLYFQALGYGADSLERSVHRNLGRLQRCRREEDLELLAERIAIQLDSLPEDHSLGNYFEQWLTDRQN